MKPNFLVFVVDQMQSRTLSCHGHPDVKTPNIDRLAREGVSFTRAYCNNPVCMPSRASLLTGLTARQHGVLTNGIALSEHFPTLPGVLSEHGYRTHAVGKLHHQPIGSVSREEQMEFSWEGMKFWESGEIRSIPSGYYGYQSVDYVGGHVTCFGDYLRWLEQVYPGGGKKLSKEGAYYADDKIPMSWRIDLPEEYHYNHWIAERSIDFLEQMSQQDQPFFLWCSFPDPHHPFAACRPYSEMYDPASLTLPEHWDVEEDGISWLKERRNIHPDYTSFDEHDLREILAQTYGMISHVDKTIGEITKKLNMKSE
ncbi:sulfatase-like hydrolase/transferase, partial [Paenibacillus cisolokensis]|uniref:sulfatase family protein n=1 Tax=Paenibacillus cisolokensis TaxID=1658519 RepID=UPI003D2DFB51